MTRRVFIVMAVYGPPVDFLKIQLRSLARQDHPDIHLVAVIADMISGPLVQELADEVGLEVTVITPETTLDSVRAFEAGLAEALTLARTLGETDALFALCDQDDEWHKDRVSRGVAALAATGADLVHSDARVVDAGGKVRIPSMFAFERRVRKPGLRGLLYLNNITGMTLLMRQRVAEIAVPFPAQSGVHYYHDLWLGLIASAMGGVTLIDAPLVDYRQHGENTIGAVDRAGINWWDRAVKRLRNPEADAWLRREAAGFGLARYLAYSTYSRLQDAVAAGQVPASEVKLAPLAAFMQRLRGPGRMMLDGLGFAARGKVQQARTAFGFAVVQGGRVTWSLRQSLTRGLGEALTDFDARLYSLSPGVVPKLANAAEAISLKPQTCADLIDARKSVEWRPAFRADGPGLNILLPTLNPTEIFAGVLTAIDIGVGLAAAGYRVRFIATDLPVSSLPASRAFALRRLDVAQLASGAGDRISLHDGRQSATIAMHRDDVFLATAWWTAHVADGLITAHGFTQRRFHYLIQDFEPNFYAWGTEFADAMASYSLPFEPIFNTTLLRDYFAGQGFGFASPDALCFRPAIDVARYTAGRRADISGISGPPRRRLAVYGRPEVARNMFPAAIEALAAFIRAEALNAEQIELVSVGLRHGPVAMPNGLTLNSLGKLPWEEYPGFLLGVDLGLSLMYSPHPSHPPIEMAASGVRVVTNSFGPKDLGQLSGAILSVAPTVPALCAALRTGWAAPPVTEAERRIDLSPLGLSIDGMIEGLAARLGAQLPAGNRG